LAADLRDPGAYKTGNGRGDKHGPGEPVVDKSKVGSKMEVTSIEALSEL